MVTWALYKSEQDSIRAPFNIMGKVGEWMTFRAKLRAVEPDKRRARISRSVWFTCQPCLKTQTSKTNDEGFSHLWSNYCVCQESGWADFYFVIGWSPGDKIIPTSPKRERDVQRRHYSLGATASSNLFFLMVLCLLILSFWSIYKNN